MPRMNMLNAVEREAFDSPPVFNSFQRKQYFDFPSTPFRRWPSQSALGGNSSMILHACDNRASAQPLPRFWILYYTRL